MPSGRHDDLLPEAIAAHDRQRTVPDDVLRSLIAELQSRIGVGPCLDAGVGTGAIAIPLMTVGTPVIGLDLSRAMLRALRSRLPNATRVPLVQGDVSCLPFVNGAFSATHCAHTLHLISDWQRALSELLRVTAPGGTLLFALGGDPATPQEIRDVQQHFWRTAGPQRTSSVRPALSSEGAFHAEMRALGAVAQPDIVSPYETTMTLGAEIDRLEHNVFARPADTDPQAIRDAATGTRAWARERFSSLDIPVRWTRALTYVVYRKPAS